MNQYQKMKVQLERNYNLLKEYQLDNKQDVFLGSKDKPRKCRFCGKTEPEAQFKKVAHAIPHFIGNRTLKSLYECDNCNEKVFSPMESHFSHFMGLYHVLSHVSKCEKIPTYKINSKDKAKIIVGDEWTDIYCTANEGISHTIDKEKKIITINGKRSYIPSAVYRLFVKMALSIMPEDEMECCQSTLVWLMNGSVALPHAYVLVRIYNSLLPFNGRCMIYKRKAIYDNNVPEYLFGLSYYNIFIQTYLPCCGNDKIIHSKVTMPFIPCASDKEGFEFICLKSDLSSDKKVYNENVSLSFSYDEWIDPNILNTEGHKGV